MGKFHDLLENSGDPHVVAKTQVATWLAQFVLECSKRHPYGYEELLREWFG
jgi:hypothetical protein